MPPNDYTRATGGSLKLKNAGVERKRKKKKACKQEAHAAAAAEPAAEPATVLEDADGGSDQEASKSPSLTQSHTRPGRSLSPDVAEECFKQAGGRQKTEAERRHDETRRKRLEDRLKREGIKTHKEKVEKLNKYLSGLSEHHDMPKIGPG